LVLGGLAELTDLGEPFVYVSSALLYDGAEDSWAELPHPEGFPTGTDHEVVWTGTAFLTWGGWRRPGEPGAHPHGELEAGALLDPVTGTWRSITDAGRPDGQGPMIWTTHGLFLWVYSPDQARPSAWLYSPDDDVWEALPVHPGLTPRYALLAASDEAVYVVGGDSYTYNEYYRYGSTPSWMREVWEFRLEERTWSKLAIPGDAAVGYLTQFVDDRLYLIDNHCAPASFYVPATGEWGATTWPSGYEAPAYALKVDGKLSLFGTASHLAGSASFFQYTP